ncbi:MAG TPA: hypothetical protein DCE43_16890, partial [Planctomycetaceae bacterium]|nr:hypothetical protein [Planctomycetaceae bacterium]
GPPFLNAPTKSRRNNRSPSKERDVPRPTQILTTLVFLLALTSPRWAQAQDHAPKVSAVLHSADRLLEDLKLLSDLTTTTEKKQWDNISGIIETFLFGIDTKKPIGIEVLLGGEEEEYRFALPVSNLKEFIDENLGGFEITSRKIGTGLYRLSENKDTLGYMRHRKGYASISESRAALNVVIDPVARAAALAPRRHSVGGLIKNKPEGQAARRKAFVSIRNNLQSAIKTRKDETPSELALRKELRAYELGEAERFVVESESLALGFRIDPKTRQAVLDLDLSAIEGTSLDKSIGSLSKTPSHFASVPSPEDSILSFRIHHPLDEFRKTSLQAVLTATRNAIQGDINRTASTTDDQKAASIKVLDTIVATVQSSLQKGILDAFVEVSPTADGNNVMVAAIRTIQGDRLRSALTTIPNSTLATDVKVDVSKAGGVAIHELTLPASFHDDFAKIFGPNKTILIGTSPDAAWCAAGPGALKALTQAITERAKPGAANPVFVDLSVTAGPWLTAYDKRMGTKGGAADRKLALTAFSKGQDTIAFQLRRDKARVLGQITLGTGILRFLGKKMAQFSKENLE